MPTEATANPPTADTVQRGIWHTDAQLTVQEAEQAKPILERFLSVPLDCYLRAASVIVMLDGEEGQYGIEFHFQVFGGVLSAEDSRTQTVITVLPNHDT